MSRTVRYHVDILGKLWLPMCDATISRTYTRDELLRCGWEKGADNDRQAEMIAAHVDTHEGDFSEIVGLRIVREEKTTRQKMEGGTVTISEKSRYVTLRDFTEDEEIRYYDCFPDED